MQTPMTSFHLIPTWHEWNMNVDDVMMMWIVLFDNFVTSHLAYMPHACMHGTCSLNKYGMSKYLSGLVCMQVNSNLEKITTSYFQVLHA